MPAFRTIFSILLQPKKRDQITVLSTIQLMKRCSGQWFETFFGYLSRREKLSEIELPLGEGFYVSTYLTFLVLFFSDYCHRVFLFFSPFKRYLRINNINFIYFDHPSRSCENFQICFPAQKKLSHQSSPCKKPFWALKTQHVIWVGKFKCSFHFLTIT